MRAGLQVLLATAWPHLRPRGHIKMPFVLSDRSDWFVENVRLRKEGCCITQLKAQGPSRTCKESKEEEEEVERCGR